MEHYNTIYIKKKSNERVTSIKLDSPHYRYLLRIMLRKTFLNDKYESMSLNMNLATSRDLAVRRPSA